MTRISICTQPRSLNFIAVDGVERNWLARLSSEQRQSLEGLDLRGRATHVLADLGWEPPPG